MSISNALAQVASTPLRQLFQRFVGSDDLPTLSDEALTVIYVACGERLHDSDMIMKQLPPAVQNRFPALQAMRTERGPFFEALRLFAKTVDDGILVGYGIDEMYYVLATWDGNGADFWVPVRDNCNRPVLP